MKLYKTTILSISLFLSSVITAITLSWVVLAPMNFLYGVWHDYGGISESIEKYGPQNKFKAGFADTTRAQRVEMFYEINVAVHSMGRGLADIDYQSSSSNGVQTLLREPEVVHLTDVAILLYRLLWLAVFGVVTFVVLNIYGWRKDRSVFDIKRQAIGMASVCVLSILILLIFGAKDVFSQFHIWVFPAENQWFFYYQESLMSTMMWAPYLFGWIGLILALLTLCFYSLWLGFTRRQLRQS